MWAVGGVCIYKNLITIRSHQLLSPEFALLTVIVSVKGNYLLISPDIRFLELIQLPLLDDLFSTSNDGLGSF